jgi:hypothetical protein
MTTAMDVQERRGRQRFLALRRGEPCFWVLLDGERIALNDLSLEGFSMPATTPPPAGKAFHFVLVREGVPDEIRGTAAVVSHTASPEGGLAGCQFVEVEDDGLFRLQDWLVTHVIMNATVRITEREAVEIVLGRSLV